MIEKPDAVTVGKSTVQFLGAGRVGSFEYEGAGEGVCPIMTAIPIEELTQNRLKGTFQSSVGNGGGYAIYSSSIGMPGQFVRQPQIPMAISIQFAAPRPHVVISLEGSGDRYPFLIVKDENGRLLDGELFNAQGLLIWLAKQDYDDVQQVDVTLLLQKPRIFTFVVPPPPVPPRFTSEAK